MISRRIRRLAGAGAIALAACLVLAIGAQAKAQQTLTVCKHGCRYSTIQGAVNASGKNATINVKPGKYVEGVIVKGHKHDGLRMSYEPEDAFTNPLADALDLMGVTV